MLYAIRAVGTEYVKIGKATSVGKRLRELETGCPHELHIEAVADWPDEEERRLHRYLEQSAVRGEWFRDGPRLEDVVRLLRDADGLSAWRAICEAKGWSQIPTERPQQRRRRRSSPYFDPKPLLTPEEKRRKEREAWWRTKGEREWPARKAANTLGQ